MLDRGPTSRWSGCGNQLAIGRLSGGPHVHKHYFPQRQCSVLVVDKHACQHIGRPSSHSSAAITYAKCGFATAIAETK